MRACRPGESDLTVAGEPVDLVRAGSAILARLAQTLQTVALAVQTGPTSGAPACVRLADFGAVSAVETREAGAWVEVNLTVGAGEALDAVAQVSAPDGDPGIVDRALAIVR